MTVSYTHLDVYKRQPKKQADFFIKKDREALDTNRQLVIEEENLTSGKKSVIISTKKVPLLDENGKPVCVIGISEDITCLLYTSRCV